MDFRPKVTREEAIQCVQKLIQYLGDDPTRDGLLDTPERVVKSYEELYKGYTINLKELLTAKFKTSSKDMVVLSNIELYSMCEHHMLPFTGVCHIAYLPNQEVIGISKLARIMEAFSRRLQIQEELTFQIANALYTELNSFGVAVIIQAQHMCMTCRGIQKQNSIMSTSVFLGNFENNEPLKKDFFRLIKQ